MVDNKKTKAVLERFVPLVAFLIFILPIVNSAIQIDLARSSTIPIEWVMVISAIIGGGISTLVTEIKKIYKDKEIDLQAQIDGLTRDRQMAEVCVQYAAKTGEIPQTMFANNGWVEANKKIGELELQIAELKAAKEIVPAPTVVTFVEEKAEPTPENPSI